MIPTTERSIRGLEQELARSRALLSQYCKHDISAGQAALEAIHALKAQNDRAQTAKELQQTAIHRIEWLEQEEARLITLRNGFHGLYHSNLFPSWACPGQNGCQASLAKTGRQRLISSLAMRAAELELQDAQDDAQGARSWLDKITNDRVDLGVEMARLRQHIHQTHGLLTERLAASHRRVAPGVAGKDSPGWPIKEEYANSNDGYQL